MSEIHLTPKQRRVVELIVDGYTYAEIGVVLGVTPHMVQKHVTAILRLLPEDQSKHTPGSGRRTIRRAAEQLLSA